MHDTYRPQSLTASCPHCRAVVAGLTLPPAITLVTFTVHCPACAARWTEVRDHRGLTRVWDPRPTAVRP